MIHLTILLLAFPTPALASDHLPISSGSWHVPGCRSDMKEPAICDWLKGKGSPESDIQSAAGNRDDMDSKASRFAADLEAANALQFHTNRYCHLTHTPWFVKP
jgi:hypothetical protein